MISHTSWLSVWRRRSPTIGCGSSSRRSATTQEIREGLTAHIDVARILISGEQTRQRTRISRLEGQRAKLLQSYYDEAISLDLFKREQLRISS